MAFLLNKTTILSRFQSPSQKMKGSLLQSRRHFHLQPGAREKALLLEDPVLKRFKSHKRSVYGLKRMGDVLTIVVISGCLYVKSVIMREEARKQAQAKSEVV